MAVDMRDGIRAVQERLAKRGHSLGFGVGIALGYATLGQIGFDLRSEYAAIGSVTNLASRLCDEAKAGQILISQRIFGLVDGDGRGRPRGRPHTQGLPSPDAGLRGGPLARSA